MTYDIGDTVHLTGAFVNTAGVATDPTAVVVTYKKPNGTVVTGVAVKDSTGNYHCDITPDADGNWYYRWAGTGTIATAEEGIFYVRPRRVS